MGIEPTLPAWKAGTALMSVVVKRNSRLERILPFWLKGANTNLFEDKPGGRVAYHPDSGWEEFYIIKVKSPSKQPVEIFYVVYSN
ncbi:hypothetical protein VQ056_26485 [Paenibacillus sp. JTLBN-2024]